MLSYQIGAFAGSAAYAVTTSTGRSMTISVCMSTLRGGYCREESVADEVAPTLFVIGRVG